MPSLYFKRHQYSCTLQESPLHHYQLLLTPYAFSFVKEQFDVAKIITTTEDVSTAVLQSSEGYLALSLLIVAIFFIALF